MARRITTVSNKRKFVIPAEIRASLGREPGTRMSVTLEETRIVLEPVSEELVDRTRGMFAHGPSLSSALKRERQKDK
jgi:AbrB family looped-hinge helix DNA binding protein